MRHPIHAFGLARCSWPREPRPDTSRRAVNARRAVERDKARAPLFPETARHQSGTERLEALRASTRRYHRQIRTTHARQLREARSLLGTLDAGHAAALAAGWNARRAPTTPAYLLDWLARQSLTHPLCP